VVAGWQEGEDGQVCCQIHSEDGDVVAVTFLRTAPEMTLSQLIDAHGEPPYLTGQEFTDDQAIGSLIYPDLQMVVYVYIEGLATGEFTTGSQIIGALYMTPDEMELLLNTAELHTWEGYQALSSYLEGDLELTPSVTLTPTPGS
jgi:hypothetical protein